MVFTYTGDPTNVVRDEVRLLIGDTDRTDALLQDAEIDYSLSVYPKDTGKPAWLAAAHACDMIVARLARSVDLNLKGLSKRNTQKYDHYVNLARELRLLQSTNGRKTSNVVGVLGGGGSTQLSDVVPENYPIR